ncbi:DUF1517 domain-containing protein [Spirulina subsalsa FACHB-351]|uniref:DUF1517 domain-containing protein n=1 Tax=Spirulina subsalsa FACHB-351 TaxID=234711 RepID=A0ABT3L544_9CYAN|nr:DUF1517 domain-containing protein [Spirulina subsalsa]MCW6036312.1 DUF1517 domain-containing protein [Spirulina subsalsa FACHB-351]
MGNKFAFNLKSFLKAFLLCSLVLVLVFSSAGDALAARSGGRIGGGSFRAPTRTYSGGGYGGYGGYRSPGGGFGFPFLLPFFGFGGFGSLFTILIVIAIANFLVNALRNSGGTGDSGELTVNSKVAVAKVQVGLLAAARDLQPDLDRLAATADTGSASGRAEVLQEATLALLRHPEYWVYGASEAQQAPLNQAEAKFNQFALEERSKFTAETLSNVENQLKQSDVLAKSDATDLAQLSEEVGEYIVVTLVVGAQGQLALPKINSTEELQQALRTLGSIGSDRLLAIEILWTPQASGDTLTTEDILAAYPNLKLV